MTPAAEYAMFFVKAALIIDRLEFDAITIAPPRFAKLFLKVVDLKYILEKVDDITPPLAPEFVSNVDDVS